jgi:hypothetical protein
VHEVLADTLLILAGVHSCATLIHHYALRDRTLARRLPGSAQSMIPKSGSRFWEKIILQSTFSP